jgi:hypothetical protein
MLRNVRVVKKHCERKGRSRDSSVGIATGYGLDDRGSIPGSERFFSTQQRPDRIWGPPSLPSNGCQGSNKDSFPGGGGRGVKREADHSPPSSARVKKDKDVAIPPLPHMSSWHSA